ncbi:MAG: thioredoxin domain-containing protein [Thermodesulfovibrio sp.]|nr:thioredoxin domain-containing protein [Thermodesulfovibrio sp.]
MNRLADERSPYLRHAATQKVDWHPWSEEVFQRAVDENKPVFLSTGAVWCHWCHVMAQECFENEDIAAILNEDFICIKLDRDERPDIDRRYQQAVVAISSTGGWPLSVFLTPEKMPFFGGTYFPPEDSQGRPGFRKVLAAVLDFYRNKKGDVEDYARKLVEHLKPGPADHGNPDAAMLDSALESVLSAADSVNGGFGSFPKFPMAGAIDLLLNRYALTGDERAASVVRKTLEAMARGGFCDQLKGGFHRYSVDEAWLVPHFEKMADDNAWHLRNYAAAYALFGGESLREVAEGIIRFSRDVLSDPAGGFYASQDADVTPDDEGGYFTWTDADFRQILDEEESRVLQLHFFSSRGRMHHDEAKHVLCRAKEPEEIAGLTGIEIGKVHEFIAKGKAKLLAAREMREAPFIDRTLYTSLNGMYIAAFLNAYRVFRDEQVREFALLSLDRIVEEHIVEGELLHAPGIPALLDDYVYLSEALLCAYEVSGDLAYYDRAALLMMSCVERFRDRESGGFFDAEEGLLGIRLKPVEDIPHPSANAVAIMLLLRLGRITGREEYRQYAEESLKVFAKTAALIGPHAAYYFCALDAWLNPVSLTVQAAAGSDLAITALQSLHPFRSIVYAEDGGHVIPCFGSVCHEPVSDPQTLAALLRSRCIQ